MDNNWRIEPWGQLHNASGLITLSGPDNDGDVEAADHLGPTEAEYREVRHGEAEAVVRDALIEALAERTDREIMGRGRAL